MQAKSLLAHIAGEVRARREVSGDEAYLIALDAYRFLQRGLLRLGPGQVELPCIAGRGSHMRRARSDQPEKLVRVSIVADEDASLLEEFGTRVMQQARIARVIEEAYDQDALFDGERLCLLVPLTLTAIRERLKGLWEEGCRLPISGMTWKMREALKAPRAVVAMERYLGGEEVGELRRCLAISRMRWQEWCSAFLEVVARCDEDPLVLSQDLGYPEEHIGLWQEVWHRHKDSPRPASAWESPRLSQGQLVLLTRRTGSLIGSSMLTGIPRRLRGASSRSYATLRSASTMSSARPGRSSPSGCRKPSLLGEALRKRSL